MAWIRWCIERTCVLKYDAFGLKAAIANKRNGCHYNDNDFTKILYFLFEYFTVIRDFFNHNMPSGKKVSQQHYSEWSDGKKDLKKAAKSSMDFMDDSKEFPF